MEKTIGCSVIIYNDFGYVLIAKRSKIKKQFPLFWETIGGAVEIAETPDECIKREVQEEIGCILNEVKLFKVYVNEEEENRYVSIVFTGKINGSIKTNCEIEEVRWIEKSDLDGYDFFPNCKVKIIDFYDEFYKK